MRARGGQSLSAATGSIGPGGLVLLNARGRMDSDSSYTPMRLSPLRDEDGDWDDVRAMQGSHSEVGHRLEARPSAFSTEPLMSNADMAELGFESSVSAGDKAGTSIARGGAFENEGVGTGSNRQALLSDMSTFHGTGPSLLEAAGLTHSDYRAHDGSLPVDAANADASTSVGSATAAERKSTRASFMIAPVSYADVHSTSGSTASPVRQRPGTPPLAPALTTSLLPTQVYNPPPESPKDAPPTRRGSVTWSTFGYPYLPPPSAWAPSEKGKEKAAASNLPVASEFEADTFGRARSRSSVDASSSGHGEGTGRGLGVFGTMTSSQGHGSATASGSLENEPNSGSALGFFSSSGEGTGSSGSHGQSSSSVNQQSHRRTLSAGVVASLVGEGIGSREIQEGGTREKDRDRDSGSFLSRVASSVSASLRRPPSGQSIGSGALAARQSRSRSRSKTPEFPPGLPASVVDPVGSKVLGPPAPRPSSFSQAAAESLDAAPSAPTSIRASALRRLSLLSGGKVTSASSPNVQAALATAALSANPASVQAPQQQQRSSIWRPQSPGTLGEFPLPLPENAAVAMMSRYSGHSHNASGGTFGRLSVIQASPLPTPDTPGAAASDGLLDPRLTARLRELRSATQTSLSTIGLRDHEDYSRPIHGLVNNPHDSYGSVSSRYSQASGSQRSVSERGGVSGKSTPLRMSASGSPVMESWELTAEGL